MKDGYLPNEGRVVARHSSSSFFFFKTKTTFISLLMAALGLVVALGLSLVVANRGCSLVEVCMLLIVVAFLMEHGLQVSGLQQLQLTGFRAQAQ